MKKHCSLLLLMLLITTCTWGQQEKIPATPDKWGMKLSLEGVPEYRGVVGKEPLIKIKTTVKDNYSSTVAYTVVTFTPQGGASSSPQEIAQVLKGRDIPEGGTITLPKGVIACRGASIKNNTNVKNLRISVSVSLEPGRYRTNIFTVNEGGHVFYGGNGQSLDIPQPDVLTQDPSADASNAIPTMGDVKCPEPENRDDVLKFSFDANANAQLAPEAAMGFMFIKKGDPKDAKQHLLAMLETGGIEFPDAAEGFHTITSGKQGENKFVFYGPMAPADGKAQAQDVEDDKVLLDKGQSYNVYCVVYKEKTANVSANCAVLNVPTGRVPHMELQLTAVELKKDKGCGMIGINNDIIEQLDLQITGKINENKDTKDVVVGLALVNSSDTLDPKELKKQLLEVDSLTAGQSMDKVSPYVLYVDSRLSEGKTGEHKITFVYSDKASLDRHGKKLLERGGKYTLCFWAMDQSVKKLFVSEGQPFEIPGEMAVINNDIKHKYELFPVGAPITELEITYSREDSQKELKIGTERLTPHQGIFLIKDDGEEAVGDDIDQLRDACNGLKSKLGVPLEQNGYIQGNPERPLAYFWGEKVTIPIDRPYHVLPRTKYKAYSFEAYTDSQNIIRIIMLGGTSYEVEPGAPQYSPSYPGSYDVECDIKNGETKKFTIHHSTGAITCDFGEIIPKEDEKHNEQVAKILAVRFGQRYAVSVLKQLNERRKNPLDSSVLGGAKSAFNVDWSRVDWNEAQTQWERYNKSRDYAGAVAAARDEREQMKKEDAAGTP